MKLFHLHCWSVFLSLSFFVAFTVFGGIWPCACFPGNYTVSSDQQTQHHISDLNKRIFLWVNKVFKRLRHLKHLILLLGATVFFSFVFLLCLIFCSVLLQFFFPLKTANEGKKNLMWWEYQQQTKWVPAAEGCYQCLSWMINLTQVLLTYCCREVNTATPPPLTTDRGHTTWWSSFQHALIVRREENMSAAGSSNVTTGDLWSAKPTETFRICSVIGRYKKSAAYLHWLASKHNKLKCVVV